MAAQLFGAIRAAEVIVCGVREPFGMPVERHLPPNEQRDGQRQQAPGIGLCHEKQGREHHGVVPVVDPARRAALVFQKPALEGTEEQYADHVADGIGAAEQQHDSIVQYPHHVQGAKYGIEADPDQQDQDRGVVVGHDDVRSAGFDVVPGELLLAAGAFKARREEAQDHLHGEHQKQHAHDDGPLRQLVGERFAAVDAAHDVGDQQYDKQKGSIKQLEIVHHADDGHLFHAITPPASPCPHPHSGL